MSMIDDQLVQAQERVDSFLGGTLKLIQSSEYFKASVDAILLANFIRLPKSRNFRYIDFCSGNGVIPLLLSQRSQGHFEGIELQAGLVDMAQRSAQLNHVAHRLDFICQDLKDFNPPPHHLYDIVSCNPPYFVVDHSRDIHQQMTYALARHEISLRMEDWVSKAGQVLKDRGRLYLVHRPERIDDLVEVLNTYHFGIYRMKFIYPKSSMNANGILIEAIYRGGRQGVRVEPPIIVHEDNNDYTQAMQEIYRHG